MGCGKIYLANDFPCGHYAEHDGMLFGGYPAADNITTRKIYSGLQKVSERPSIQNVGMQLINQSLNSLVNFYTGETTNNSQLLTC